VLSRAIPDFGIAPDTVATLRQSKWQVAWDKGGITVDEIRDRLQSAVNWADQPPEISVRPIGWGCFILQPAQQGRSH
jgi:hypothetical protein